MKTLYVYCLLVSLLTPVLGFARGGQKLIFSTRLLAVGGEATKGEVVEARILVSGSSVQGGYYRAIVKNEACMMRKLRGSLHELADGNRTELVVQGSKERVESFVRWVEKGPPLALRDPVIVEVVEYLPQVSALKESWSVRQRSI